MEYIARGKSLRQSPRKVSLVAKEIRRKSLLEARRILKFSDKKASRLVLKVLESGVANAKNRDSVSEDNLLVTEVLVGPAPTYKRHKFGARGRLKPILKRNCHITIKLEVKKDSSRKVDDKKVKKTDKRQSQKSNVKGQNHKSKPKS